MLDIFGLGLTAPLIGWIARYIVTSTGDAVISRDYYEAGRVFEQVYDLEAAQASLRDVMEVADVIVPAHDNVFMVAGR